MFDGIQYVWKSADVDYAIALAKGLLPLKPHWLEEPLRPDDLEGYVHRFRRSFLKSLFSLVF